MMLWSRRRCDVPHPPCCTAQQPLTTIAQAGRSAAPMAEPLVPTPAQSPPPAPAQRSDATGGVAEPPDAVSRHRVARHQQARSAEMTARRDPQPGPAHPDQRSEEALERTLLADDRTLLAWYRTAFGAYALAVGLGGVVPAVSPKASDFYRVIGVIFA